MKHHIVIKFIAILLCAASLLGALGSGLGILFLTEQGLYSQNVEDAYRDYVDSHARYLAQQIGQRHATMSLGGANSQLADSLHDNYWSSQFFDFDRIGYVILDENGSELLSQSPGSPSVGDSSAPNRLLSFSMEDMTYARILSESPESVYSQEGIQLLPEGVTTHTDDALVYSALPANGADVFTVHVQYEDGSGWEFGSPDTPVGFLYRSEDGAVRFLPAEDYGPLEDSIVVSITFTDLYGQCIYEVYCPDGVLGEYRWSENTGFSLLLRNFEPSTSAMDAIPPEGCAVTRVSVAYADGFSESAGGAPDIGFLDRDPEGRVRFVCSSAGALTFTDQPVIYISFHDEADSLVYEIRDPNGAGRFILQEDTLLFLGNSPQEVLAPAAEIALPEESAPTGETALPEETAPTGETILPEETAPTGETALPEESAPTGETALPEESAPTGETALPEESAPTGETALPEESAPTAETVLPEETPVEMTLPAEDYAVAEAALPQTLTVSYWDHTAQQSMTAEYVLEPMPEWTVKLTLAEGAIRTEYSWVIARLLYRFRDPLPYLLAACLLVFAIVAVYLCCAAGKSPGSTAVRAGGLNRLPLDLYGGAVVLGLAGLWILGIEGGDYLLRRDVTVGLMGTGLCAYAASLLLVSFCFACAAQFKTPGGFWWRNSLCGLSIKLAGKLCRWLLRFVRWSAQKSETVLWPRFVRLIRAFGKILKTLLQLTGVWLLRLTQWLRLLGGHLGRKLSRFLSLLPLTWQWLLIGFLLVLWLFLAVDSRSEGMLIAWVFAGMAAVLYGAHCFGTLLESAGRMSKGDLEEKVDDKLMVGAFRDFAVQLNSLADVAVIAAQKQLRSERMKTELITNVSHDIKTPLTSIINYVDLLQKPHTPEDREKYLEVLDRQSQRLKKLIDDLMEMSKASTGNLAVDITRVDAAEAVNQALGEFSDKLDKARLFPVLRQPEEPVYIMADGRLVWRVLSNLLSNAVKYALPGTRVYVDLQKLDSKVILSIKNISREELNVEADELLERFVRGDASRNTEGSGLGLNIARSLMELQKGQLQILVDGDLFKVTLFFPAAE